MSASRRPHIVVALVDDVGWHNVGWRNPQQRSPNIDALARSGAVLRRHYAYKTCSPSRSSLFSGRLPLHVNEKMPATVSNRGGIDLRMTLLPQKLKLVGYVTAMYGKWHIGARQWSNLPTQRGFDHFLGFLGGAEDHYAQTSSQAHGSVDLWDGLRPAYGRNGTAYSCNMYASAAVRLIRQHDATRPLFLVLSFQQAHSPFQCPWRHQDASIVPAGRRIFHGMVTCVDEATRNVTSALKDRRMWQSTFVLWTSDNGGDATANANNHPLRGTKGTDFEGGVRVVAFVAGGALKLPPGSVVRSAIHICDWYATFCSMAGVDPTDADAQRHGLPPIDSVDLSGPGGVLSTPNAKPARTEVPLSSNAIIVGDLKFVRNVTWYPDVELLRRMAQVGWTNSTWPRLTNGTRGLIKAVEAERDPGCSPLGCLFNLTQDVSERNDLSTRRPAALRRLRERLAHLVQSRFQTEWIDPRYSECTSLGQYVARHAGFSGPVCENG